MKKHILGLVLSAAFATSAFAETSVKISGVHLCCGKCVTGAEKAVASVSGATAVGDKEAKTVVIKAADAATVQKAADALVAAGFFGTSEDAAVKLADSSGAKDAKVSGAKVTGVHLCCDKCVKAAVAAVESVKGVTGNTAAKNAESFEVKGEFNAKELAGALEKAGMSGKIAN